MFKKRIIVLITQKNNWRLKTDTIWFWKSKKKYLNDLLFETIKETNNDEVTNIKMY